MEPNQGLTTFLVKVKTVLYGVLQFLSLQELSNVVRVLKWQQRKKRQNILGILLGYTYIRTKINGSDRSCYNMVYENHDFLTIQKSLIVYHLETNNCFEGFYYLYQHLQTMLLDCVKKCDCLEAGEDVLRAFRNPEIPSLKLVRETVGIGCRSVFQNYLVSLSVGHCSPDIEKYQNLCEFFQKRTEIAYLKQFFKINKAKNKSSDFVKINNLRFSAYHIKCTQIEQYFLSDNELHNLLVMLFGMADLLVQSSAAYLEAIDDPFYRLMELVLRYEVYRNFVLNIQEQFAFVFEAYANIYEEVFFTEEPHVKQFSFWRPAFSKWLCYMEKFHEECMEAANLYTLNQRVAGLKEVLAREQGKSWEYMAVQNQLELLIPSKLCRLGKSISKQIYELIEEELLFVVNEFRNYMVDLSLDEVTVHWCGYSQQRLGLPYKQYQKRTLQINNLFYDEFLKINKNQKVAIDLLKTDAKFMEINQCYSVSIIAKSLSQLSQKTKQTYNAQFKYELHNSDEKIKMFNSKAKIPVQIENQRSREMLRIWPVPEENLNWYADVKSFNKTMDSSKDQCLSEESASGEDREYHSDNDEDDMFEESEEVKKVEILSFLVDGGRSQRSSAMSTREEAGESRLEKGESSEVPKEETEYMK